MTVIKDETLEIVTLSKKDYDELIRDRNILNALYANGVDNWEWYEDALDDLEDE